jgi:hypothetical protein
LHKKEATRFAQDATLLFSLFVLRSFGLLCIGGTHTLFVFIFLFIFFSMLESFISIYVTLFFFCVSFSPSLLQSFAQHTHTLTVVTLVQCFATLGKPLSMG